MRQSTLNQFHFPKTKQEGDTGMSWLKEHQPAIRTLELAVELARINGHKRTASEIIQDAALLESYLIGDLPVIVTINDGAPNFSNIKSVSDFFSRSLKILKNSFLRKTIVPTLQTRFSKRVKQSQNQIFTRCAHSSSPHSVSKDAPSDSTSEGGKESVAYDDLSHEKSPTLYHLAEHAQSLELVKAARAELDKRRGII